MTYNVSERKAAFKTHWKWAFTMRSPHCSFNDYTNIIVPVINRLWLLEIDSNQIIHWWQVTLVNRALRISVSALENVVCKCSNLSLLALQICWILWKGGLLYTCPQNEICVEYWDANPVVIWHADSLGGRLRLWFVIGDAQNSCM